MLNNKVPSKESENRGSFGPALLKTRINESLNTRAVDAAARKIIFSHELWIMGYTLSSQVFFLAPKLSILNTLHIVARYGATLG